MAFIAYPLLGVAWTYGEASIVAAAAALAASGAIAGVAAGVASGHHTHHDPHTGVAPDDEDHDGDYPSGKDFPEGSRTPDHTSHITHQEAYINNSNEVANGYWHKFNIICRRFYNRHRIMAINYPERYALALFYFLRRNRHVPRRIINRSALLQGDAFRHTDNTRIGRRVRGAAFLAS